MLQASHVYVRTIEECVCILLLQGARGLQSVRHVPMARTPMQQVCTYTSRACSFVDLFWIYPYRPSPYEIGQTLSHVAGDQAASSQKQADEKLSTYLNDLPLRIGAALRVEAGVVLRHLALGRVFRLLRVLPRDLQQLYWSTTLPLILQGCLRS